MGTYAAYSLVAVVPTGLLLVVRYAFVYALCCKATKERRSITISSAHPLALNVSYPAAPAEHDIKSKRLQARATKAVALSQPDSARGSKLAS